MKRKTVFLYWALIVFNLMFAFQKSDSVCAFENNTIGYYDKEHNFVQFSKESYEQYLFKASPILKEGEYYEFRHQIKELSYDTTGRSYLMLTKLTVAPICGSIGIYFIKEVSDEGKQRYVLDLGESTTEDD